MSVRERPFGWHNIITPTTNDFIRRKTSGLDAMFHAVSRTFKVDALKNTGPYYGRILSKENFNPGDSLMQNTPGSEITTRGNSPYRCKCSFEDSLHSSMPFPSTLSSVKGLHHAMIDMYPYCIPEHSNTGNPQLNDYVLCDVGNASNMTNITFRTVGAEGNEGSDTNSGDRPGSDLGSSAGNGGTLGNSPFFQGDPGLPCIPNTSNASSMNSAPGSGTGTQANANSAMLTSNTHQTAQTFAAEIDNLDHPGNVWGGGISGVDTVIYTSKRSDLTGNFELVIVFPSKAPSADPKIINEEILPSVSSLVDASRNFLLVMPTGNIPSSTGLPNYCVELGKVIKESYGVSVDDARPGINIVGIGERGRLQIEDLIAMDGNTGGITFGAFNNAGSSLRVQRLVVSPESRANAEAIIKKLNSFSNPNPADGLTTTIDADVEKVVLVQSSPPTGQAKLKATERVKVKYRPGNYKNMKKDALQSASSTYGKPIHTAACVGSPGTATPWNQMPTGPNNDFNDPQFKQFLDTFIPGTRFKWGAFVKKGGKNKYPPGNSNTFKSGVPVNTEIIWKNISNLAKGVDAFWTSKYPDAQAIVITAHGGFRDLAHNKSKKKPSKRPGFHHIGMAADIRICKTLKSGTPGQVGKGTRCAKYIPVFTKDANGMAMKAVQAMQEGVFGGARGGIGYYPGERDKFVHVDIGTSNWKDPNSFSDVFPTHHPFTGDEWGDNPGLAKRPMTWTNDKPGHPNFGVDQQFFRNATADYRAGKTDTGDPEDSSNSPKNIPGSGIPETEGTGIYKEGDFENHEDTFEDLLAAAAAFNSELLDTSSLGISADGMGALGIDPYAHNKSILQASALNKTSDARNHVPKRRPTRDAKKVYTMGTVNAPRPSESGKQRINVSIIDSVTGIAKNGTAAAVKINIDMRYPEIASI